MHGRVAEGLPELITVSSERSMVYTGSTRWNTSKPHVWTKINMLDVYTYGVNGSACRIGLCPLPFCFIEKRRSAGMSQCNARYRSVTCELSTPTVLNGNSLLTQTHIAVGVRDQDRKSIPAELCCVYAANYLYTCGSVNRRNLSKLLFLVAHILWASSAKHRDPNSNVGPAGRSSW